MVRNNLENLREMTVGDLCEQGFCTEVIEVREDTPFKAIVEAIRGGPLFHSVVVLGQDRKVVEGSRWSICTRPSFLTYSPNRRFRPRLIWNRLWR